MPRIPTYQPRSIPLGRITSDAEKTGIVRRGPALFVREDQFEAASSTGARALAGALDVGLDLGDKLYRRKQVLDEQDALNYVITSESQFHNQWIGYLSEARSKSGMDTFGNVRDAEIWIGERQQEFIDKAPNDAARQGLQLKIQSITRSGVSELAKLQVKERKTVQDNTLNSLLETKQKAAYLGTAAPEELTRDMTGAYGAGYQAGFYDESEARVRHQAGTSKIYASYLDGLLDRDPEAAIRMFEEGRFVEFLKADQIDAYGDRVRTAAERIEKDRIEAAEKAEAAAEERLKKQQEDNAFSLLQKLNAGQLTRIDLEKMATVRAIDKGDYKDLSDRLEKQAAGEKVEDDPITKGELAERLALGEDIREDLRREFRAKRISDQTYTMMMGQAASKQYQRGLSRINVAMKPGLLDKFNEDINLRHSEAVDEYNFRIGQGEDPEDASLGILRDYRVGLDRSPAGLRNPRFHEGSAVTLDSLTAAERLTAEKFAAGAIDVEAFNRETTLMQEWKTIMERELKTGQETQESQTDARKRAERIKKAQR